MDGQGPPELGQEALSQNGPEPGGARHTDVANLKIAADGVELTDDFLESAEERLKIDYFILNIVLSYLTK